MENDPEMTKFVEESAKKRNSQFTVEWDEIIGESKTPISGSQNGYPNWRRSCWGNHVARATRKAVGAGVGVHVSGFAGVYKPTGPVTFGDIVENFPHVRKPGDQGWEIATVSMSGWKLKPLMKWAISRGYGVDFSGLGYNISEDMDEKAIYKIAFPAEIAHAVNGSLPEYRQYLTGLKFTGVYLWPVLTQYLKDNSPITCP
jgi:2',3'-cyclic-nucleotide 2'-phosphodiesterase (5'-nucleotidase family)